MILSVEVPDPIAAQLQLDGVGGQRRALEIIALEGFRVGDLSHGQVGELLGLGFAATEEFLKVNGVPADLGIEEHSRGLRNLQRALGQ